MVSITCLLRSICSQVHFGECGRLPGSINGQPFIVRDCSDAAIFLFDNINTLTIDDCNNCTIIVGPTAGR